jgi:hypothetical protein
MFKTDLRRALLGIVLLGAGMIAGAALSTGNVALGQARSTPPSPFQSGGQMSVPILKEISATLHQIDARIARLETVAQKLQVTRASGASQSNN